MVSVGVAVVLFVSVALGGLAVTFVLAVALTTITTGTGTITTAGVVSSGFFSPLFNCLYYKNQI